MSPSRNRGAGVARVAARLAALLLPLTFWPLASAATPSEQLSIGGAVRTPVVITVEQLTASPAAEIESVALTRRSDGRDVATTLRGVRLTSLLDRAQHAAAERNDWKHTIVVATATDGYRVVFSWSELFNSELGRGVLVVFERDGQPLGPSEGRIALVSARDLRTGPRSVKWLRAIDVRTLKD